MIRDPASQAQVTAAQPNRSTWLSANAGSGKTRVLTDRVARLLLDGENPQNILCLTYTKAAASEMQNRLFKRLGAWAMLPDDRLESELRELGIDTAIDADDLSRARRLFALAIETPGGLKIQTIHSFCSALLRRFPLEANVTPQFTEMEERAAVLLRKEIVDQIANGPNADALYAVARQYTGETFESLTNEIIRCRAQFEEPLTDEELGIRFGQSPDVAPEALAQNGFLGGEDQLLAELLPALRNSGSNDQKAAQKLAALGPLSSKSLPVLEDVFLTGRSAKSPYSAKIGTFPTKSCRETVIDIMPQLEAWMQRVEAARPQRLALQAMEKTRTLHSFARIFLPAYDAAKQIRGWLDFDDLILRARDLLTDPEVAQWVLFRLDGAIDHILVDEAQDTSPLQWQVIERLAQEFTSGEGARKDRPRTIFVVGDKKQSIYSFQGADPREFDRMQREFTARLESSNAPLNTMELAYSFRSSHAILTLVDHTFSRAEQSGFAPEHSHIAFKADLPGRVDLWPVIPKPEAEDKPSWFNPVDVKAANDPAVLLARQIAQEIKYLIDTRHPIPEAPEAGGPYRSRPVQPKDFLILVQRRSDLFQEIIRECKALDLPIAGADRLKVGAELAVRDLAALLSFLATPEDSLSLATALKSPLFGWSEQALFQLAHYREQPYLWATLRTQSEEHPETLAILNDLLGQTDFLRPYELIERILTRHHGRHRLLSRLGPEAEDGIDALLSQAMAYERNAVDSLTGFLIWMETDDLEIKRQMDSAGNRIRVMTVHGAKGLEAPIVILPDTGKRDNRVSDQIILQDGTPLWRVAADDAPALIQSATEDVKNARRAERDRLLYVAMTRAETWLIVVAAGEFKPDDDTWYNKVRDGLAASEAKPHRFASGDGLRLSYGNWAETETVSSQSAEKEWPELPAIYLEPAPEIVPSETPLRPSDLGGAKALPGEAGQDEETAKHRGRLIHSLLEVLPDHPEAGWPDLAARLIGQDDEIYQEALRVLTATDLAPLFRKALREVPISAQISALGGCRIHGIIDLLVIESDRVLAVDFKSNMVVPDTAQSCPDGLLRQMGAYAHALQQLYPSHEIQTALLWTKPAQLMMLPHDLVTEALHTTQIS